MHTAAGCPDYHRLNRSVDHREKDWKPTLTRTPGKHQNYRQYPIFVRFYTGRCVYTLGAAVSLRQHRYDADAALPTTFVLATHYKGRAGSPADHSGNSAREIRVPSGQRVARGRHTWRGAQRGGSTHARLVRLPAPLLLSFSKHKLNNPGPRR